MFKKDFTLKVYDQLLQSLLRGNYIILTYENYIRSDNLKKHVILRHDVDKLPENALKMAQLENSLGIKSSYYFRIVKSSNDPSTIKKIVSLGHEIGYHYEDLTLVKGDYEKAIELFEKNLNYFRKFYDVKTIAYHGSPMTRWNNKDIWEQYDYKDFNILAEPFFDIDFNKTLYLTDTGRSWGGRKFSVRDKVNSKRENDIFYSTFDIVKAIKENRLQNSVHMNVHSQRWHTNLILWFWELCFQNIKNQIKKMIFVK